MSDSHKSRHGMHCKIWKDSHLSSRCHAEAHKKNKKRSNRAERRTGKATQGGHSMHHRVRPPMDDES